MTWTYSVSDLATSEKDQIRLEIQDTDSTAPLLADEEILQAISVERNFWNAAARCCEIISRNFLRKADVRIGRGGTSLMYSTAAKQYAEMATALRLKAIGTAAPWAGGRDLSDKVDLASDPSKQQPIFTKTVENSPWVGGQGSESIIADQDD